MGWAAAELNGMLDSRTVNSISLHTDDPGPAGLLNEVAGSGYARQAAVFDAADGGERLLNADLNFTGPVGGAVTYLGFWDSAGPTFRGSVAVTGDQVFNSSGEYVVKSPGTKLAVV